jgi:hypothetical protein
MPIPPFGSILDIDPSKLPETFMHAIDACRRRTQAPVELILASALGAASLACQEKFDVLRPTGNVSPLSLYLLTIAESGERKTTVDNFFQEGVRLSEINRRHKWGLEGIDDYAVRLNPRLIALKIRQSEQRRKYRMAYREGASEKELAALSHALDQSPSLSLPDARLIFMNSTLEALLEALATPNRGIGLISDEGGVVLDSRISQHLSSLNVLWEGGSIFVDRASKPSFQICNSRLTISIMSQPGMFRRFIWRRNSEARDLGFLARALTCCPRSTQGTRKVSPSTEPFSSVDLKFYDVVKLLLEPHLSAHRRIVLRFDSMAAELWLRFAQNVEDNLALTGYFGGVKDFGSKLADNVARLAGIFAIFSKEKGDDSDFIDTDSVQSAIHVGTWYAREFVRLFGDAREISEDHELCKSLVDFLSAKDYYQRPQDGWWKASDILKYGPPKLRNARALDAAINYGAMRRLVEIKFAGRTRMVRKMDEFQVRNHLI